MNLKNAGNIGSEESAKHNAFMYSIIESCKECGGLSEGSSPSAASSEEGRGPDVLPAMLHVLLTGNQKNHKKYY